MCIIRYERYGIIFVFSLAAADPFLLLSTQPQSLSGNL